jgi:hypothetical protein
MGITQWLGTGKSIARRLARHVYGERIYTYPAVDHPHSPNVNLLGTHTIHARGRFDVRFRGGSTLEMLTAVRR